MNDADLIVLDIDGGDLFQQCIDSIAAQSIRPRRVIIVDNGSDVPVESRLVRPPGIDLCLIRSKENCGFTGGINRAMAEVGSELVGFVNSDVRLDPSWLETLRAQFEDPALAAVQSVVRRDDGLIDGAGIDIGTGTFRQLGHGSASFDDLNRAWGISATAALYRVNALRSVALGGATLHPAFFAYYEDVELSARLRKGGWGLSVVPAILAAHRGSESASRLGRKAARLRIRNRYYVSRLHPGVGRARSLLREDASRIVRLLRSGRIATAFYAISAVIEGLFGPIASE